MSYSYTFTINIISISNLLIIECAIIKLFQVHTASTFSQTKILAAHNEVYRKIF